MNDFGVFDPGEGMLSKDSGTKSTKRIASEEVETFLASLDHPSKPEILAVRQLILAAYPTIGEGIKWKVPSFHTSDYFATIIFVRRPVSGSSCTSGQKSVTYQSP